MSKRIHFLANRNWSTVACGREINSGMDYYSDRKHFANAAKAGNACAKCVTRVAALQDDESDEHEARVARDMKSHTDERKQRDLANEGQNAIAIQVRRNVRRVEELESQYLGALESMVRKLQDEARRVRNGTDASTTVMSTSLVEDIAQLPVRMQMLREQTRDLKEISSYLTAK